MDYRKISLCIPTWERVELLFEAFSSVLSDRRISEVIIVDDASSHEVYWKIFEVITTCNSFHNYKIKLFQNRENLDCYLNKREAISKAANPWCIILDSDNVIDKSYLDRLYEIPKWDNHTSYMPSFAADTFNYQQYAGLTISSNNVASYMGMPLFDTMLNCFNMMINRDEYLRLFDASINPHTADSLFFNYTWFAGGNKMYVVPDLKYMHRIHKGHYVTNNHLTGNTYKETEQKLRQLK